MSDSSPPKPWETPGQAASGAPIGGAFGEQVTGASAPALPDRPMDAMTQRYSSGYANPYGSPYSSSFNNRFSSPYSSPYGSYQPGYSPYGSAYGAAGYGSGYGAPPFYGRPGVYPGTHFLLLSKTGLL